MKKQTLIFIHAFYFTFFWNVSLISQSVDYRDVFLGLYHTSTPPCVNSNEQNPPNRYILIEKDTQISTDIIITDTSFFGTNGFIHSGMLIESDSTYTDGVQYGKFVPTDSLRIGTGVCGFGAVYYLRKIASIGLFTLNNKVKEWYLFPNPAVNEFNIVLPGLTEEMSLQVLDINGKLVLEQKFKTSTQLDVSNLPKGVYLVRIQGNSVNLNKRVVLVD